MTTLKKLEILCLQETPCGPKDVRSLSIHVTNDFNRNCNHKHFGGMLLPYEVITSQKEFPTLTTNNMKNKGLN